MRKMIATSLCLAALAISAPAYAQRDNPAYDDITEQGQDLANCAGVVAAHARLNPVTHPQGAEAGEWADVLTSILTRLHVEPGLQGMTGRYAASAARTYWAGRSRSSRTTAANQCRERYAR